MNRSSVHSRVSIPDFLKVAVLVGAILVVPPYSMAENQEGEKVKIGKPRVLFMIAEQNIGQQHAVFWWWGQSEFVGESVDMSAAEVTLKEMFLGRGFAVVDVSATTGTLEISNAYRIADLTDKGAREIAKTVNAEVVVKGKAVAKEGPRTPGSAVGSYLADVTATAIRVDDGAVLASARGHGVSRHVSDVTGGTEALGNAGTEAADRLIEQISATWPEMNQEASPNEFED